MPHISKPKIQYSYTISSYFIERHFLTVGQKKKLVSYSQGKERRYIEIKMPSKIITLKFDS